MILCRFVTDRFETLNGFVSCTVLELYRLDIYDIEPHNILLYRAVLNPTVL